MMRLIFAVLTFVAVLGLSSAISQADDLQDVKKRAELAASKIRAQVEDTLEYSRKQTASDAKFSLLKMIRDVQASPDLQQTEKTALVRRLEFRLTVVDDGVRANKIIQDQKPYAPPTKKLTPPSDPSGGVSGYAKKFIEPARTAQQTQADLIRERERLRIAGDLSREKSAVNATDKEIAFPANWRDVIARRPTGPKLTEKEAALLKTLNSTLSLDYDNDKFKAVINHLQERTGLNIMIDDASMKEAMVDYDDPVTWKTVRPVTVRTALKKILGDKRLTYIIQEGAIQVMTPEKAAKQTVVRTYPIDDLVTPLQVDPRMAFMFGRQLAGEMQAAQAAQQVINLLQTTIQPDYWQPNGPGSIVYFPLTKSLVIRATAEMHFQLAQPGMFGR